MIAPARGDARGDHRLRRGQPAAQRRQPGRVRRPAGDPRLPPQPRRRPAHRVPDPVERARHQRGQRGDGRHEGGRRRAATTSGNVDLDDLRGQGRPLPATRWPRSMVTYPSTHGVFEAAHRRAVRDRARRTAGRCTSTAPTSTRWSGWPSPGKFGADVSHLNLHKTFCIPHGGGGPGVGPVAVRAHLAAVPARRIRWRPPASRSAPVSAAPFGSAEHPADLVGVHRADGRVGPAPTRRATAILNANYVATRLHPYFPVLYTGEHGRVAHECIVDLRPITKATGVTVDDVAKRLIDYGFHAPTMSFPVAGTLMIEPTESETLHELDRFCDAMIAIRAEIDAVAAGDVGARRQPAAQRAAHRRGPASASGSGRTTASSAPIPSPRCAPTKYFPPVSRIDAAYGDRNLVCSCEPLEALAAYRAEPEARLRFAPWLTARTSPRHRRPASVCSAGPTRSAAITKSIGQFQRGVVRLPVGGRELQQDDGADARRRQAGQRPARHVEEPIKALVPQITRTHQGRRRDGRAAQRRRSTGSLPACRGWPTCCRRPRSPSLPNDLGEFMDVLGDVARRLQPLGQLAESAGSMFGLRPFAALRSAAARPTRRRPLRPPPSPPPSPPRRRRPRSRRQEGCRPRRRATTQPPKARQRTTPTKSAATTGAGDGRGPRRTRSPLSRAVGAASVLGDERGGDDPARQAACRGRRRRRRCRPRCRAAGTRGRCRARAPARSCRW